MGIWPALDFGTALTVLASIHAWWHEPPTFRWGTPLAEQFEGLGARKPHILVTRTFQEDFPYIEHALRDIGGYENVHHDFDRDCFVWVWIPFAPFVRTWYWWRYRTSLRWSIERWMNRRIADKPEGECFNFALLGFWRHPRRWSWRRTSAYASLFLAPGLKRAFIDDYANWTPYTR